LSALPHHQNTTKAADNYRELHEDAPGFLAAVAAGSWGDLVAACKDSAITPANDFAH
jgi:hypothetical protein